MSEIKCVFVGDSGVGKSYLIITYISNIFPNFYRATSIDTLKTEIERKGKSVTLILYDTGGSNDYDRLRPMFYKEADIVIMCFSVTDPNSLENLKKNWISEVRHHAPFKPIILVGTKSDLRNDLGTIQRLETRRYAPITYEEGRQAAHEINALKYFEISSLLRTNLKELFVEIANIGQKPSKLCPCSIL